MAKIGGKGLEGTKSKLFYEFVRLVQEVKPKYFLLENVASMKNSDKDIITKIMGVEPITINSALFSALNRKRHYWTNLPVSLDIIDKQIYVSHIVENNVEEKYYLTEQGLKNLARIVERSNARGLGFRDGLIKEEDFHIEKFKNLDAHYGCGCDGKRSIFVQNNRPRKATPVEAERLQTLPDNYTALGKTGNGEITPISNTQRYKGLGNGWTVDVIAHIFKELKNIY